MFVFLVASGFQSGKDDQPFAIIKSIWVESNSPAGRKTCRAVVDRTAVIQPINRRYSAVKRYLRV
jgi:hypothetical protein